MSRPNAALSLPLGDRDELPPVVPDAEAAAVAGRKPSAKVLRLAEKCTALARRIADKRKHHQPFYEYQLRLQATRLAQLKAEISDGQSVPPAHESEAA